MTDLETRLHNLRGRIAALDIDALVVEQPSNRKYVTGFGGSNGLAIVGQGFARLITDGRYYGRAASEAPGFDLVRGGSHMLAALKDTLSDLDVKRIGLEADYVTVDSKRRIVEAVPDVEWTDTVGVVAELRAVKAESEVAAIRAAAELTDHAMVHAYEVARPGMTERDLAWRLEVFMRERGAEGTAFAFIVGGGPNGALPHHETGDRPLQVGEPIVIDMGARLDGYNADLTRTFCWGSARDPDYAQVWELVRAANAAALDTIKPGMTGVAADALARDRIAAAGFGNEFGHGLGHGVGMDIHELPRLGPAAGEATLNTGNIVTVEPGVYLPDRFGVRIEDLAVLRESGLELLSHAEKVAELPVPRALG